MPSNEAQVKANLKYRQKNREKCREYSRQYNNQYRTEHREEYNAKQRVCALNYYNRTKDKQADKYYFSYERESNIFRHILL